MNDIHLSNFLRVAEESSMTAAAQKLFISPQALQQQMSLLEKELGFKILTRTRHGVKLTAAGEELRSGLQTVLPALYSCVDKARAKSDLSERTIIIVSGGYFTGPSGFFPALRIFREKHPGIEVEFLDESSNPAPDIVLNDILFRDEYSERYKLYSTCLYATVHAGHPISGRNAVESLNDLTAFPIIIQNQKIMADLVPEIAAIGQCHNFENLLNAKLQYQICNTDLAAITIDKPIGLPGGLVSLPIKGTEYDVQLKVKKRSRPIVMEYVGFMSGMFGAGNTPLY